ncbi:MAG: hypothetical protein ACR2MT_11670 [Aurantibacter sp.]
MKPGFVLIGLILVQILTSCTTNKLLSADFEGDTVGSLPALGLPGEPAGDEMQCIQCGSGDYRVISKTSGTPPETTKWLEIFGNISTPTEQRTMIFVPIRRTLDNPVYTVTWRGSIVHPGRDSNPFYINLFSGSATGSQSYFSLIFKRERHRGLDVSSVYLSENGEDEEDAELIGRVRPDAPHAMTVFINSENRTFTIAGSGLPNNIEKSIPSSITNVREPVIWMSFVEPGIGVYQIDNIQIIEGKRTED